MIYGGNFGQGFAQGAATAAFATLLNDYLYPSGKPWDYTDGREVLSGQIDLSNQINPYPTWFKLLFGTAVARPAVAAGASAASPYAVSAGYAISAEYLSNAQAINKGIIDFFSPFANLGRVPSSAEGWYGWTTNRIAKKLGYIEGP